MVQRPRLVEAVPRVLGLWGVGNTMIIFLAAVLDVPRHLYESADLDGAGALQRLRWVTLPTISPVILFAVVIGVIEGLQYFTQAYVAASVAAGPGGDAESVDATSSSATRRARRSSTRSSLYHHGFRYFNMGYASAMAMLLLVVAFARHARDHAQLAAPGPLPGAGRGERRVTAVAPVARPQPPRAVRRRRLLVSSPTTAC